MPKRLMSAAVAVALLAGGIVLGSLTSASSQGRETTRIRVFNPDRQNVEQDVRIPPRGEDLGDYFIGHGPLVKRRGGREVGNIKFQCFEFGGSRNAFTIMCNASFWLEGRGKISAQGAFTVNFGRRGGDSVLPITGGVGEFNNARGTVKVEFVRRGANFVLSVIT